MYFPKVLLIITFSLFSYLGFSQNKTLYKFDFGSSNTQKGFTTVTSKTKYSKNLGYGFVGNSQITETVTDKKNKIQSDYCSSSNSFYFSVDIPEGNYDVKLILGDKNGTSNTTIKVENRRLMLEGISTTKGEIRSEVITVNVRTPKINDFEKVLLKPREKEYLHWDAQLTIEFAGDEPKICGMVISKAENIPVVFLSGNSTVVDQAHEPFSAWGQMIPRFFEGKKVVVANFAESGETIRSFVQEKRLDKVMSLMKAGDYFFIEFAHNDQKPNSGVFAQTTYKEYLRTYIQKTLEKGATPVLVTSMHRRRFADRGKIQNSLENFPDAMREVAKEQNVALIDLNIMSKTLYEALGVEESKKIFLHYPANSFSNNPNEIHDDTHFSNYGAYQLAKCVLEGIKTAKLPISKFIVRDFLPFNPAQPDAISKWKFPPSPYVDFVKPDGN